MLKKGIIENPKDKKKKETKYSKIKNSNIDITYEESKSDDVIFSIIIKISDIIEPAPRPRTSNRGGFSRIYDPLSTYKNYIHNKMQEFIEENDLDIELPYSGPLKGYVTLVMIPTKGDSQKKKYLALKDYIFPLKKPDLDNCEKTIYDCFNGLLYEDDKQIVETRAKKLYGYDNNTVIKISFLVDNSNIDIPKSDIKSFKPMFNKINYKEN